ncbi:MAG: amino acid ABC transporter substrate-binding protein [Oscillospiraceae bacterium]|nr:amino acid ABC transporter substrate-binding protein [Oscillospiraceae bacterium]
MKKNRMLAAFAAMMMLALTGCAGGNSTQGSSEASTADTAAQSEASAESAVDSSAEAPAGDDESLQKVLDSGEFVLGLDASFPPMGFTDEDNNIIGFDIDVAQEVCDRLGVTLVKQPIVWDAKEQDLNAGKIDCIWNGLSINPSRAEAMNLSDPYMENEMIFVVPADSEIKSLDDLTDKTIGVQLGSTAEEILEGADFYDSIHATPLEDNVEALRQMELGFSDAVFMDSVVANYLITSNGKDFQILDEGLEKEEYAIGFRKGDQALRDEVQKTLSEMKADGKLGEISTKWFGSDVTTVQ